MPQSNSADDTIRHRCTHMLANALRGDDERHASAQDEHLMQIASEAEAALYARYRDKASTEYKTAVRSRLWNLRNSENPMLRERLLNGLLSPQQFANMTDEEMSSVALRTELRRLRRESARSSVGLDQMVPMTAPDIEEPMERIPIDELEPEERETFPGTGQYA